MSTTAWFSGANPPGEWSDTPPVRHLTWVAGWLWLTAQIDEHLLAARCDEENEATLGYDDARDTIYSADYGHPFTVLYDGLVWWLADVPVSESVSTDSAET